MSKFSWYASAFLLWIVACFIGVVAMAVKGFERMFGEADGEDVLLAAGSGVILAAIGVAAISCLVMLLVRRDRVTDVCADLLAQCAAILCGGLLVCLYASQGLIGFLIMALLATGFFWPIVKAAERTWIACGTIGLAWCTAAVPIILGSI